MNGHELKNNNKGFSLVELIVVMAIMVVAVGATALSMRLLTGAEAKQCANKFSADLEETKTTSMARFGQSITFGYLDKDASDTDSITKSGFYSTKTTYYMTKNASGLAEQVSDVSEEHRYLGNSNVEVEFGYCEETPGSTGGDVDLSCGETMTVPAGYTATTGLAMNVDATSFSIFFDRTTGLYHGIAVDGAAEIEKAYPLYMTFDYGNRTYIMTFDHITGKHSFRTI